MTEHTIHSPADFPGNQLSEAGQEAVLSALEEHEAVVKLAEWLAEEKELEPTAGRKLFAGRVDASTDAAWLVKQDEHGTEAWVPRSAATLYERHPEGIDRNPTQQLGLDGF